MTYPEIDRLLSDPEAAAKLAENARRAVLGSRGATERTLDRLDEMLAHAGLL